MFRDIKEFINTRTTYEELAKVRKKLMSQKLTLRIPTFCDKCKRRWIGHEENAATFSWIHKQEYGLHQIAIMNCVVISPLSLSGPQDTWGYCQQEISTSVDLSLSSWLFPMSVLCLPAFFFFFYVFMPLWVVPCFFQHVESTSRLFVVRIRLSFSQSDQSIFIFSFQSLLTVVLCLFLLTRLLIVFGQNSPFILCRRAVIQ